jgi:hypothetical protein
MDCVCANPPTQALVSEQVCLLLGRRLSLPGLSWVTRLDKDGKVVSDPTFHANYPRIPARRAMQALADAGKVELYYQGRRWWWSKVT